MTGRIGHRSLLLGGAVSDANFGDVVLLLHMDGTNGGTTFTDSSSYARTASATNCQTTTAQSKFGTTSGNGVTDENMLLSYSAHADFTNAGAWTLEFFIYCTSFGSGVFVGGYDSSRHIIISSGGVISAPGMISGVSIGGGSGLSTNTWYHIALCRTAGNEGGMYVDGVIRGSWVSGLSAGDQASPAFGLFGLPGRADLDFNLNNYIDEVRFTRAARYPGGTTFTPPSAPFPDS